MTEQRQQGLDVSKSLETLCKKNDRCSSELQGFLAKQIWTPGDRQALLDRLCVLLVHPVCTLDIAQAFRGLQLDLLHRAEAQVYHNGQLQFVQHQKFCIALSKTLTLSAENKRFSVKYLQNVPAFYKDQGSDQPVTKKAKKSRDKSRPKLRELVQAVHRFLLQMCSELRELWDWSDFILFLQSSDVHTRWHAVHSVALLLDMAPPRLAAFRRKYFTPQEERDLSIRYDQAVEKASGKALLLSNPAGGVWQEGERRSHTMKGVVDSDLSEGVVAVCGVLLPKMTIEVDTGDRETALLLAVPSTHRNMHSVALAVASGHPVLLEGPVGCGKTALVEYLALLTGRVSAPQLLKVQLGDQTDSKALLGTYRCTDVPGQFEWQAGSLTQAVTAGHWILLEDLDYAPMDVVSMLVPLLEGNTLSVPGHGDVIKADPGFRLFATQRLMRSEFGWYKTRNSGTDILERMWTKICVEPLSRAELQQVIVHKYPQLTTVVDRLLDIYFLLSAGRHDTSSDTTLEVESDAEIGKFLTRDGRLISTRDLMKWCGRIARCFEANAPSAANLVFQEALDCFCASLPHSQHRQPLAEAIASRLNLTRATAEYYCTNYKPTLDLSPSTFTVGRVSLPRQMQLTAGVTSRKAAASFAFTRQSVALLEQVAVCVAKNEPVLLVGETGTGKTSSVQFLSQQMGEKLRVINMNQQSDSADLLGGFKPVDLRFVVAPFREQFEMLFCATFSRKQNRRFLGHIQECFASRRWADLFKLMSHTQKAAVKKFAEDDEQLKKWTDVGRRLRKLRSQVKQVENALAFTFVEGTLVRALRQGEWVLLDEINLASAETLECLSGLLESTSGSVVLMERGDTEPIVRHENFRLFACMNPATDVGKKELPLGVRNRFTEFFVDELEDPSDLKILVREYLKGLSLSTPQIEGVVKFYLTVKGQAAKHLTDGTGHKPHYSLRTLCRALKQAAMNACESVPRSLYEGFCLAFLTQLDRSSHPIVEKLICEHIIGKSNIKSLLKQPIPAPPGGKHVKFEGYWVASGDTECVVPDGYVLTPLVRSNLRDLTRVVSAGRYPVLLQGETSVGKTSLITWLARASGNTCVRINNHEHTDLQEYIGCYAADNTGKLAFREGVLVEAMRKGHWIILDELNLAPSDVLEALNRLLDDNRELFIPETQETVNAHPRFMLFATQNPPGQYAGRKVLSRAFRNRFVELHFDEIPSSELETILHKRCSLPLSHCRRLVKIMLELQVRRRSSGVFAGKQGYITLRDLFRWAERYHMASQECTAKFFDWDQLLADNGYMLLAGRVRKSEECHVICEVIEKHLKRRVDPNRLFTVSDVTSPTTAPILSEVTTAPPSGFEHVVWTYELRRMAVLVGQALKFGEPVLLVGDTGCGKTTVCQLFAALKQQRLYAVNCHMHTESADFLGGLRPVRHHSESSSENLKLFEWCDGPLVSAMKEGTMFLVDEISLADDSVLERLNSVLEPERTLVLAEKGGGDGAQSEVEQIHAGETFRIVATMNPGGDYGKKELSPALRNRFTEIWCPQSMDRSDLIAIIEHNLSPGVHLSNQEDGTSGVGRACLDFVHWFTNNSLGRRATVSIRDLLSWVNFINVTSKTVDHDGDDKMETDTTGPNRLEPAVAYVHGACMTFLDALGSGVTGSSGMSSAAAKTACLQYLMKQVVSLTGQQWDVHSLGLTTSRDECAEAKRSVLVTSDSLVIWPFSVPRGPRTDVAGDNYALDAPTTYTNAQRVLRALQLPRPILLEGSPGVGKTSLVAAIARAAGHHLVRINLSEQTDVTDLFGADLPVEGGKGGEFAWRDGPLLRALKAGHWIVLDELNLASQSVLEGLNACLDHRAEVYVPELGMTFHVEHGKTRLFACQNPLSQGGGRKGLPKSFLNRFTQVYVEQLTRDDLLYITGALYPQLPATMLAKMVDFNNKMFHQTMIEGQWGRKGSPWEFNLRDICRWCDLLVQNQTADFYDPGEYVALVYSDRMRTAEDKQKVFAVFEETFETRPYDRCVDVRVTTDHVQIGHSWLERRGSMANLDASGRDWSLQLLHHSVAPLESLMKCVEMSWMAILIGPAGSGKTSLVRLLAQLSGRPLHVLPVNSSMDTTELLGGFEQADLNRHLEELSKQVKETLSDICSQLLLTNQSDALSQVRGIMGVWTSYRTTGSTDGDGDTKDDVEETRRRLATLDRLVCLLLTAVASTGHLDITGHSPWQGQLTTFSDQLARLTNQLQRDNSTNHGGRFEWVDSMLVDALQAGHWLLIDNANFCSPSVLDRLNALLEPGGVLSINERGVIDGQIPSISPHPDFRLILAMDPKHGEISRAMRNRGVEIYIPGESHNNYDRQDVRQMLGEIGLADDVACDTAIGLHDSLQGAAVVPRAERFGLLQLLQAARLTAERLERGVPLGGAIIQGFTDVYVRGLPDVDLKQKLATTINEFVESQNLLPPEIDSKTSCLADCILSPNSLPTAGDWCQDVTMATVRQNGALLIHLINQLVEHTGKSPAEASDHVTRTRDLSCLLPFAVQVCLESTAYSDHHWHLTSDWLTQQLQKLSMKGCGSGHDVMRLGTLSEVITSTMEAIFSHPLMGDIQRGNSDMLDGIEGDFLSRLEQQPWDIRWNSSLLKHYQVALRKAQTDRSRTNIEDDFQQLFAMANQLYIVGYLAQSRCQHANMEEEQGIMGRSSLTQLPSMLQLSKSCHEGVLQVDQLPDRVIAHLYPFVSLLDEELQTFFKSNRQLTDEETEMMWQHLWWYERFVSACRLTRFSKNWTVPNLALHWNWLKAKTLAPVFKGHSLSPALQAVVTQLESSLGGDCEASKLFQALRWTYGHPRTCQSETMSGDLDHLVNINRRVNAHKLFSVAGPRASTPLLSMDLVLHSGTDLRTALLDGLCRMREDRDYTTDDVGDLIARCDEILERHSLYLDPAHPYCDMEVKVVVSEDIDATKVMLWPVYDLVAVRTEFQLLAEFLVHDGMENGFRERVQRLIDFYLANCPFTPPTHLLPWKQLLVTTDVKQTSMENHSEMLLQFLDRLYSSPATNDTDRWLLWQLESTNQNEDRVDNVFPQGPATLHLPVLSHTAFSLMTNEHSPGNDQKRAPVEDGSWLPSNVRLGECREKVEQIRVLNQLMWTHSNDSATDTGGNSLNALVSSFTRLVSATVVTMPEMHQSEAREAFESLPAMLASQKADTSTSFHDALSHASVAVLCPEFGAIATRCVATIQECSALVDHQEVLLKQCMLGEAWTYTGLLQSFLLVPQGPVDPVEKIMLKLRNFTKELEEIERELRVRRWHRELLTGQTPATDCLHPREKYLAQRQSSLQELVDRYQEQSAWRHVDGFANLLQEAKQFLSSIGSVKRVLALVDNLKAGFHGNSPQGSRLHEVRSWLESSRQFLSRMEDQYLIYRDLLVPFWAGLAQMQYGLSLMIGAVDMQQKRLSLTIGGSTDTQLEGVITALCPFPAILSDRPNSLALATRLLNDSLLQTLRHLLAKMALGSGDGDKMDLALPARYMSKCFKCALLHLKNHAMTTRHLDTDTVYTLSRLFHLYVGAWRRAEREREEREREKESLYRYKTQSHGDGLTEEEREERDMRENFPTFEQDFEDIIVGFTLDDKPKRKTTVPESSESEDGDDNEAPLLKISQQEMISVCEVHRELFTSLTTTLWHQGAVQVADDIDYVQPVITGYQVAALVEKHVAGALLPDIEGRLLGSHLLVSRMLQSVASSDTEAVSLVKSTRPYDVYHDPNVPEVVQCRPLLERFITRVHDLLKEWPDHPTLKQLVIVTKRVLSFPVTSPVMKFVTGLEVLLQKAQEWESNAAKHVTLREHLDAVTQMVIQWRKLELRYWNNCLDVVAWQVHQRAARWWFHLYQLVQSHLQPPADVSEQTEADEQKKQTPVELIKALQQFIEGSTLGEYDARLGMFEAFHCQVTHMDQSEDQRELAGILWSVHAYYSQFRPVVQQQISKLRSPIEKLLKGFVKVARWNDINFYALKQTVEKTHRTLHKHMKAFENVLRQPARTALTDGSSDWAENVQGKAGTPGNRAIDQQVFINACIGVEDDLVMTSELTELQKRLPSLTLKARKHSRRVISSLSYPDTVTGLGEFTDEIIETVHDLQALDASQIGDEKKRKSEVKHIQLRKRKALADLFRQLAAMGLSYRKGLIALRKDSNAQVMCTSPLDVTVALSRLPPHRCDHETTTAWEGCLKYHVKCVARRALFHTALQTPSQELGPANIDRCKGFAEHIMCVVVNQWQRLAQTTQDIASLRQFTGNIQHMKTGKNCSLPPQERTHVWLGRLKTLCDGTMECLRQYQLLLQCCPTCPPGVSTCVSPHPASRLAPMCQLTQQNETWTEAVARVQESLDSLIAIKTEVERELSVGQQLYSWSALDMVSAAFERFDHLADTLQALAAGFNQDGRSHSNSLAESLFFVTDWIKREVTEFTGDAPVVTSSLTPSTPSWGEFTGTVDLLLTDVLLAIQSMVNQVKGQRSMEGEGQEDDGEEEEDGATVSLLMELQSNLERDYSALRLNKILHTLSSLEHTLTAWSSDRTGQPLDAACQLLSRCLPLLQQYGCLVQYHLTVAIATHRASSKLLSVLLRVFSDLAQKGFCLPADMTDEMEGEGATQFEDIEGGGMGEGEGAKDVSDQIETEDQLDEAHKAGEEKPEQDPNQQPDIAPEDNAIEMSEDIDGKLHDLEAQEGGSDGESENEMDEKDLDQQMGDLDGKEAEKLDEQIWGSDEEEEEEEQKEGKEEFGAGDGAQSEAEMVAKDDNKDGSQEDKGKEGKKKEDAEDGEEQGEEKQPHALEEEDDDEYDENERDDDYNKDKKTEEPPPMDLPDDLNLDGEQEGKEEGEKGEEGGEENPLEIDKMIDEDGTKGEEKEEKEGEDKEEEDLGSEEKDMDTEQDGPENDGKDEEGGEEGEGMEVGEGEEEETPKEDESGKEHPGLDPQDIPMEENEDEGRESDKKTEDAAQAAEHAGKTENDSQNVQESELARDGGAQNEEEEREGGGVAESERDEGHEGETSTSVTTSLSERHQLTSQRQRQRPGQSTEDRSLGSVDKKVERRLKTIDTQRSDQSEEQKGESDKRSELYEHVKDAQSQYDTQTMDAATANQQQTQPVPMMQEDEEADDICDEDTDMRPDDSEPVDDKGDIDKLQAAKLKSKAQKEVKDGENGTDGEGTNEEEKMEVSGEKVATSGASRGAESSFHTAMEHYNLQPGELDVEKLRAELEQQLQMWNHPAATPDASWEEEQKAVAAWHDYETLTQGLAQELCEQLRLVLEPSQATKLRGDYRTGKRLNMRKVIPYIASQFRKDKIWLRRTKPSKRQYQVMVAVDDSSSMADNHSRQLAFESLAVIANALTLLEVGEVGICSFGESTGLLHSFQEQFNSQSGAKILQQFSFEQKKTKIAQLLKHITAVMMDARSHQRGGGATSGEISQLLLIVSDGRGLFLEGMEAVKSAVRQAMEANVFVVFVVIDNPNNKDSILDIRVPVFKGPGQLPEIKSYMDIFPFPFYVILRDTGSLPYTLSDALRQWFELVTATDK